MMDEINDNNSNDESLMTETKNEVKIDRVKDRKRLKDETSRKRDMKRTAEQFLEAANDVQTLKEKLDVMCKKYSEIVDDNKKLLLNLKQSEKKIIMLQREKEQFQSERNKALLTRKRLENLCRELHKQTKAVKEECLSRLKKEEEKSEQLSDKFQSILDHVNQHMNLSLEKNAKIQEENLEMNKLFKCLCDEVAVKEKQLFTEHMCMKGELLMARDKLEEVKIQATVEKEAFLREKQQLLIKLTEYQTRIQELQATEAALKNQIDIYTDKYDEFQDSLTRSNKVCGEFNDEMERMSKKILTLEKETSLWKHRWEKSNAVFLEMASEKQAREAEVTKLKERLVLLQDLCRIFQNERNSLIAQLNEKNAKSNGDSTTRTPSESQKNNESKEKEDTSKKESTALKNNNEHVPVDNGLDVLEERLETESNLISKTEKKDEKSSEEKVADSAVSEPPLSSESSCTDTNNKESKDEDLTISQEHRTEEPPNEEESSNVEITVEDSSKTDLSTTQSSPVISTEELTGKQDVENENKEAIERVIDTSCNNVTELEPRSENIENENTVQTSIPEKVDVLEEQKEIENSSREDSNEKLIENIENRCNGVTIFEIEAETTTEQCVPNNLPEKDVPCQSLETTTSEIDVNECDKLQETDTIVKNVQEVENSEIESKDLKDSTEANPVVGKQVKTNVSCTKEDCKSAKQVAATTTKNGRRKRK